MFRLPKNRHSKSGDRVDFRFSQFKLLQVPRGWDRLFLSVVSVETGKAIGKTGKSLAKNGICQWSETLTESIWVSQDESSKEMEDCLFKFVVAAGSARSGVLGEATLNMTGYMSSSVAVTVSLPLKKGNLGTTLQVKIQCLTPRTKLSNDKSGRTNSIKNSNNVDSHDVDINSDEPETESIERSIESSSPKELDSMAHQGELETKQEASFSASASFQSYDSVGSSIGRENFSQEDNLSSVKPNLIWREDSTSSDNSVPRSGINLDDPSEFDHSSFDSRTMSAENKSQVNQQELSTSSLRITGSSKNLLEAAEETIEELHGEARMWERNAQKLKFDLDMLRREYSDQSKSKENLDMELSAANAECTVLRKEVERLTLLLGNSVLNQTDLEGSILQDEGVKDVEKELENEIKFLKESNANLALQLQRSQDTNIELVSVLQELEETIEKQKLEIEDLSALQSQCSQLENPIQLDVDETSKLIQMKHLQESEKNLQAKVQLLEQALEEKEADIEKAARLNKQTLSDIEEEYKSQLSAKEREIVSLKAKLSESLKERCSAEMESKTGGDADLVRENEALKAKLEELEKDCNELTDENLDLLFKLKETKNKFMQGTTDFASVEFLPECSTCTISEESKHECRMNFLKEKTERKVPGENEIDYAHYIKELESLKMQMEVEVRELGEELIQRGAEIQRLEANLQSKEEENGVLRAQKSELEAKVYDLQIENCRLEDEMEAVTRESGIATNWLGDMQNDLMVRSDSMDSHVSANKILQGNSLELESVKSELESRLSWLERENMQLVLSRSDLEAQIRDLKDERDSAEMRLENSNTLALRLKDEIARTRNAMESQEVDMKQQLQEMHNQLLETRDQCEYLRTENSKLHAFAESLTEECNILKRSNEGLRKQNMALNENCAALETELMQSTGRVADCSKKVEVLEERLYLVLEDFSSKENNLTLELDAILDKNRKLEEKLKMEESSWNQMHLKKTDEVENLQQEVESLTKQLTQLWHEKERIACDAEHEISILHADKVKLESDLQAAESKLKWTDLEFRNMQVESEGKLKGLMGELSASRETQEALMANHARVLKLLENYKSSEEKLKTILNGLELELTVSEYERQKLTEESSNVNVQLLKVELLRDEVLALRDELNAANSNKEELEASLHLISRELEDLKAERTFFLEQISASEKAISELKDHKHSKEALEEKLLEMEANLMAKEALFLKHAEVKIELGQMKKANRHLQNKIQQLEEEKNKLIRRTQTVEEEMKFIKAEKQNQRKEPETASMSSLEAELRDIQQRYLEMSLKYAEVECQREELVMKLKGNKNVRWFSSPSN
ncbi:hypothetical protein SLE2022_078230 [Rubroshorea leprosula]